MDFVCFCRDREREKAREPSRADKDRRSERDRSDRDHVERLRSERCQKF